MREREAIEYIHSLKRFGGAPSLFPLSEVLRLLGSPQKKYKIIHIAGTNGKGSVSNYIASALNEAGYKTGLFTSPFIYKFQERFQINGKLIGERDLVQLVALIKRIFESVTKEPKQFDFVTALGLLYFAQQGCEYAVIEAGMGGRSDSTNVIEAPVAAVITALGLDHTNILGDTIDKIAYEKAGIIKAGTRVYYYPAPEVESIIKKECLKLNAVPTTFENPSGIRFLKDGSKFTFNEEEYAISMYGRHQVYNACLSILVLRGLNIPEASIKKGLSKTRVPGRFEKVHKRPDIFIDGAHNPQGAHSLLEAIRDHGLKKCVLILSMGKDKDYVNTVKAFATGGQDMIFTSFDKDRAISPHTLMEIAGGGAVMEDIKMVVGRIFSEAENQTYIFCGSLYSVDIVSKIIKNEKSPKILQN